MNFFKYMTLACALFSCAAYSLQTKRGYFPGPCQINQSLVSPCGPTLWGPDCDVQACLKRKKEEELEQKIAAGREAQKKALADASRQNSMLAPAQQHRALPKPMASSLTLNLLNELEFRR